MTDQDVYKAVIQNVFEGDVEAFNTAYVQALMHQIKELQEVNPTTGVGLMPEEIADAMYGVLLQWLGRHSCCPREDIDLLREAQLL